MGGRIRTVKPELFLHEALFDAEEETGLPLRLSYIGLFTQADREGRFRWQPRRLKAQILPYDDVDFSRVLDALATRGFLVRYASPTENVDGDSADFGAIPTWKDHQHINNKERPSAIPPVDATSSVVKSSRVEDASSTRCNLSLISPKGNKEQGTRKGTRNKEQELRASATPTASVYSDGFLAFWDLYPKKVGKRKAAQRYNEARTLLRTRETVRDDPDAFLLGVLRSWVEATKGTEIRFIPHPETWLNQGRYDDPPPQVDEKGGSSVW